MMQTIFYRFIGDTDYDDPADMQRFYVVEGGMPRTGEYLALDMDTAHQVVNVAWFPCREYHSEARVPVLILQREPL